MKWKLQPTPKEGDIRRVVKFAFFPTVTEFEGTKYRVWLETYLVVETFFIRYSVDGISQKWLELRKVPLFGEYERV